MKDTTLLIMAAGLGSRYQKRNNISAIKQLEPVGQNGEIIMDYSIHDAIQAGFNKIILVIRPDIELDFKDRIGRRVQTVCEKLGVKVEYCYQTIQKVPGEMPLGRTKPWGTGQAVLAARDLIHESFAVINADDYYGKEAFRQAHDWLVLDHAENAIAMAGFILKNTLSDHGGVTRGVCKVEEGHTHVVDVVETADIIKTVDANGSIGAEADGVILDADSYVSMNFWAFPAKTGSDPWYMNMLESGFKDFYKYDVPCNPLKAEYLLPTHIGKLLQEGLVTVKILETSDHWFGVTYPEDKDAVIASIQELTEKGVYGEGLYSDLQGKG